MADSGAFDQITDSLETLIPSIFNFVSSNVIPFLKNINIILSYLFYYYLLGEIFIE